MLLLVWNPGMKRFISKPFTGYYSVFTNLLPWENPQNRHDYIVVGCMWQKCFNQSTICWMWEKHYHTCTCIHIGLYWYPNYRIQTWCSRISMSLGGTVIHIYRQVNNVWGHNSCYNSQIKMTWKWEFQRFHNHIPFCNLDIKNVFFYSCYIFKRRTYM